MHLYWPDWGLIPIIEKTFRNINILKLAQHTYVLFDIKLLVWMTGDYYLSSN